MTSWKPACIKLDGRHDRRRPRRVAAIAHRVVGIFEGQPDEFLQGAGPEPVLRANLRPLRLARADLLVERQRRVLARHEAQRIGDGWPHVRPHEHVAVGDIEDLVPGRRRLARPGDGARQKVGIDRLRHAPDAAGIIQLGLATLVPMTAPHHCRIDAQRRDHVHGAAHRIAHDQHRSQDRPVPALARLLGA
jgi:hypothetical protein